MAPADKVSREWERFAALLARVDRADSLQRRSQELRTQSNRIRELAHDLLREAEKYRIGNRIR